MDSIQAKIFNQYKNSKLAIAKDMQEFRELKKIKRGSDKIEDTADIITCLDFYYRKNHSGSELKKIITDGNKDLGFVDAIVLHGDEVDIFDIKSNSATSNDEAIKNGIDNYFESEPQDYSSVNSILASNLKNIHKQHYKIINLIFVREFTTKKAEEFFLKKYKYLENKRNVKVKIFTRLELLYYRQKSFDVSDLILKNTNLLNKKNKKIDWAITVTPLIELLKQYNNIPDRDLLFFKNIRKPLEEKKLIDILSTSLESDAETFHYRHNGIVMTGSLIMSEGNGLRVYAPQVLNGAQTLGALFKIYNENISIIKKAKIVVKVLSVDNQQVIDSICEAANTQRSVTAADIRTNDSLQKNLELYIGSLEKGSYYYLRGKISSKKIKEIKKKYTIINKESFIQWANSAFLKKPYESKNQKTKLFTKFFSEQKIEPYKKIEESIIGNWENIERLCKVATYFEKKIKKLPKNTKNNAKIMDQHIIASMYELCLTKKKLTDGDMEETFDKSFEKHILAFNKTKRIEGKNFKMRNYFISDKSF